MHIEPTRQSTGTQGDARARSGARPTERLRLASSHPIPASGNLQSAWIELLSRYHWDLFGSLTFRDATHPESAYKRFRLFLSMLNRKLYSPRWAKHKQGVSYCVAMERQQRGVLHFHVLLADPELTHLLKGSWFKLDGRWANELNEMWNQVAGFARIEAIKALELVQRYVSKYVIKGGEIDLGGPLMQRRLEQGGSGRIVDPRATVQASEGTERSGLHGASASVPGLSGRGQGEGLRGTSAHPVASHLPPFEAGSAGRSDLAGGARVHGVAWGDGNLPFVDRS